MSVLIIKNKIMKKTTLGMFVLSLALLSACTDSHDDHDECEHCHIAFINADGNEVEVEIMNAAGGDEFCGAELEEAEGPDFSYTLDADVIVGNDTVPAGQYTEIHCGHADH
tara:strand:- start:1322 stop:1654 length:333 start_codon:yes stop_codon:yes gene_type:complete